MDQPNLFSEINREKLTLDLFQAYFDARKNKRNTINALAFEKHFESNLFLLRDQIISGNYIPNPSICFVVNKPVKREIFAADFRDRVVHHLIYNYISPIFEKTFINDSYSCRKNKGTHYGIKRIDKFIRSCSQNYSNSCYILKLDIKGYFMAMNKNILFNKLVVELKKKQNTIDFDISLVLSLIEKTIFNDPRETCVIKGKKSDWNDLPKTKSLFFANKNCGLPIGNLTSQLFGNIFMNEFDHWVKQFLGIKYYGRYVDDIVLIHNDKQYLQTCISLIKSYLKDNLHLVLHPNKIYLQHYSKGVKYLGAVIKPHRIYVANRTKGNFYNAISLQNKKLKDYAATNEDKKALLSCMNSYLGIMKPYKTFKMRHKFIFKTMSIDIWRYIYTKGGINKLLLKKHKDTTLLFATSPPDTEALDSHGH